MVGTSASFWMGMLACGAILAGGTIALAGLRRSGRPRRRASLPDYDFGAASDGSAAAIGPTPQPKKSLQDELQEMRLKYGPKADYDMQPAPQ